MKSSSRAFTIVLTAGRRGILAVIVVIARDPDVRVETRLGELFPDLARVMPRVAPR